VEPKNTCLREREREKFDSGSRKRRRKRRRKKRKKKRIAKQTTPYRYTTTISLCRQLSL